MGSVIIRETSKTGEGQSTIVSTIEYEFSDIQDYILWSDMKQEALSKALKSFSDSLLDTQDEAENNVTEIKVGKKSPTKH